MQNIKPVYVFCQEGTEARDLEAITLGIQALLKLANVEKVLEVRQLGVWRRSGYEKAGQLVPEQSIDWYISVGHKYSRRSEKLNAGAILGALAAEQWQKREPHYDVVLAREDLYDGELNFVAGATQPGLASIISPYRFIELHPDLRRECLITLTMHELGHVFGLVPKNRPDAVESLGSHCPNVCLMSQGLYVPGDWLRLTSDRLAGKPLCDECLADLRRYFA